MQQTRISYSWRHNNAAQGYHSGVSLHGHTNQSKETLDFLAAIAYDYKSLRPFFARREKKALQNHGIELDYAAGYWTPPLTPRMAFDLEQKQIEDQMNLPALVSLTDHDNINAPLLLRTVPSARHIPISVEWTAPFMDTAFHLGIHNLPSATGIELMKVLDNFTHHPSDTQLTSLLADLHSMANVLIIFNHPLWDLYRIGHDLHRLRVDQFLARNNKFMHAFELNGLREWHENRETAALARKWNQITISGGDRHGIEPNANINLTHATSFTEFVHEVRYDRVSHVHFMPQYAEPWKYRMLQSVLDAVREYPEFPQGMRHWDERVFHPDAVGEVRPIAELWPGGRAPYYLRCAANIIRILGMAPVSGTLRYAWRDSRDVRELLGNQEVQDVREVA
jgi:hypothetical protein